MTRIGVIALVSIIGLGSARAAQAQSFMSANDAGAVTISDTDADEASPLFAKMVMPSSVDWSPSARMSDARGPMLPLLYGSLISLQAFDGYSTTRGLQHGAVESNGLMASLATHTTSLWAVKGVTAFASIYVAERLWRQHRRGQAIAVMIASNAMMAAVAANNAAIVRHLR
jgi:uncharacterized protein DUF5658